ncbi:AlkA N-terminal domain-containing protein [Actinocatenispora rupis]|uniref:DNA-3-methyladenine glycosylase II n=1 Tax=Actinocatenispora rupis TaxID=519421 RepID=A0A8J3IXG7_9ACTN|nr:AlkA N-terminal domain-containing protein [Actinocatenispora rupis]GID10463.1 DNA-3-methyladenine glycosylase [Actinocatenispora rupis]
MNALPDFEHCYRAVASRDRRFDGWFFTAVTSTKIYCRPSCPAQTPKRMNVRFYRSAAAAQRAGFRACMRCRPDAAPGSPEWDARADVAGRAMRLIADGVVDRDGVAGLARRLGYTERHLNRLLSAEVGAGPLALARAQRAQTARILIETTELGLAEVAFAAGFGSIRQFNDTVRAVYGGTPSELRAARRPTAVVPQQGWTTVPVRLAYREPFAAGELFAFLGARVLPGVEGLADGTYRRAMRLPHGAGWVALTPADGYVAATLHLADVRDLSPAVSRCRRLLDLSADPDAVDGVLGADPALRADVAAVPGVRLPRSVDGFEMLCRAIVGQQVSVAAARSILGALAAALGERVDAEGLTHTFPTPAAVAEAPDELLPMPNARRRALRAAAALAAEGAVDLNGGEPADVAAALLAVPGIGPWTVSYVMLRGLGEPDTFLEGDLGVRRGAAALGLPDAPKALAVRAGAFRPWRSYAVIRLWRHAAQAAGRASGG